MTPEQARRILAAHHKIQLKILENRNHYWRYQNAVFPHERLLKRSFYQMMMRQIGNRNQINNLVEEYRYADANERAEIWSRFEALISEYE